MFPLSLWCFFSGYFLNIISVFGFQVLQWCAWVCSALHLSHFCVRLLVFLFACFYSWICLCIYLISFEKFSYFFQLLLLLYSPLCQTVFQSDCTSQCSYQQSMNDPVSLYPSNIYMLSLFFCFSHSNRWDTLLWL